MERQEQNEMVCAQNPIFSRNDEERKNRIDDGKLPAETTTTGGDQPAIHQALTPLPVTSCTTALVSLSGTEPFPSCPRQSLTLSGGDDDKRLTVITVKNAIDRKSWLTMTA